LTNCDWLKRKRPQNASRTATQVIFRVRKIADCQVLASRNARLRRHRAKLAAASLNRSRLALITIEIDPQVIVHSLCAVIERGSTPILTSTILKINLIRRQETRFKKRISDHPVKAFTGHGEMR
jgi:hypothetical protein